MKIILFIISLFFFLNTYSQKPYLEKTAKFSERTYTYQRIKKEKNLKLDFYKPKKIKGKVPLLIYVHGGGFSGGSRSDKISKDFAIEMAAHGYAVASISYRLTMKGIGFGCTTNAALKIQAFNDVSKDISYAVQYFLKRNRKFKIDTDKIILVGSSAGAEAVLNLAYVYENKILDANFKFAGIIAMAGATISVDKINEKTAIPTQLFHGIKDNLVPYNVASHHYCKKDATGYLPLFGSKAIADKLKSLNKPFYLYSIKEGDHSWNARPIYQCKNEIIDFLYYDVLHPKNRQIETEI
ncbi:carboxylesterase family protein [Polaribacter sargassicola]|uniref:carboxylesterase family protein n=1 Tax=Polaribacter sargassicola TaxID=2836891 RepID=UPI001F1A7BFE|nr:carboxylesterase family protein [Polaribacter sp. DS7-9]MCG1035533.1 carboxylesterase family protein [Polaribacter sp. DS7-9]